MPTKYAEGTKVPSEKSQMEIQQILKRYGTSDVASGEQGGNQAIIAFRFNRRAYKIILTYPDLDAFKISPNGKTRTQPVQKDAREQEIRRLWRVMLIVIKGKLEATQSGIISFEEEFMAHIIVTPDGQTMGQWIKPQLDRNAPLMLPPLTDKDTN
jgi:hypothetical protein